MVGKWVEERERGGEGEGEIQCGADLYVLPEGCIAAVVSLTTPRDACRLASVSKVFQSAADSDSVWERFLPSDYRDVIAESDACPQLISSLSRKDLFFHLVRRPLLLRGATKSFSLDRFTGKKCYAISARELAITWGDTPRYWKWRSMPNSRFPEVAELITVCWLEIKGTMKTCLLSPDTSYAAHLVFKMTEDAYGFYQPAKVSVKTAAGKTENSDVYLDPLEGHNQRYQIVPRRIGIFNRIRTQMMGMQPDLSTKGDVKLPKPREDGWMEIEIGEFATRGDEEGKVEMSVAEVEAGNWKGGMIVEGIEIRPKVVAE